MKPSAFEGVNKWMDGLTGFVRKVDTFIESQMVKDLMGFSWDQLGFAFNDIFKNLEELARLYLDIKTGQ